MKPKSSAILILLAFICLAVATPTPNAFGVVPAPDGCYPIYTTAEGCNALSFLVTGVGNTGVGSYSLFLDTTGNFNTGVGGGTLALNNADSNTAVGTAAMLLNTTGEANTAVGTDALLFNGTGGQNTATGAFALFANTSGMNNTAVGYNGLTDNTTGNNNTSLGYAALANNTTGSNNTVLGSFTGANISTASNVICIGADGQNVDNSCFIGNIFMQTTSSGVAVLIDSNNKLGTATSSRRFKEDIQPMGKTSEQLYALQPVSFHYKKEIDPAGTPQLGLVAEDVEEVNPELVVRDKDGKPYSVRYDQVNAMLLNEFLKEHRKVEDQQAAIAALKSELQMVRREQQSEIQMLTARLEQQSAQIQSVQRLDTARRLQSAQMVMNNP